MILDNKKKICFVSKCTFLKKIIGKEPWKAKFNNRDKTILPSLSGLEKGNLMNLCTNRHKSFFFFTLITTICHLCLLLSSVNGDHVLVYV